MPPGCLYITTEDDLGEALTPFSLMHGRNSKQTQSIDFVFPSNVDQSKRCLSHIRKVVKDFWMRFWCTYLNELPQMNIYLKSKSKNVRTVGDVALICDDDPVPQAKWRIGQIL